MPISVTWVLRWTPAQRHKLTILAVEKRTPSPPPPPIPLNPFRFAPKFWETKLVVIGIGVSYFLRHQKGYNGCTRVFSLLSVERNQDSELDNFRTSITTWSIKHPDHYDCCPPPPVFLPPPPPFPSP